MRPLPPILLSLLVGASVPAGGAVAQEIRIIERDTNGDGKSDFWVFTKKDLPLRAEADLDGDGLVDTWCTYRDGRLERVEKDQDGDGRAERISPLLLEKGVSPYESAYFLQEGEKSMNLEEWEKAEGFFIEAARADPSSPFPPYHLAVLYRLQGEPRLALRLLMETLSLDPNHFGAHYEMGRIAAGEGRIADAFASLRRAAEIMPENADVHYRMALALGGAGRTAEALEELEACLKYDPDHTEARMGRAALLARTEKTDDAEEELRRVLKRKPDHTGALIGLSQLLLKKGETAEAFLLIEKAVIENSESAPAHAQMARTLEALQRREDALLQYRITWSLEPSNAGPALEIARLYGELGMWDAAANTLRQILQSQPKNLDALKALAGIYPNGGVEKKDAIRLWQNTLLRERSEKEREKIREEIRKLRGEKKKKRQRRSKG